MIYYLLKESPKNPNDDNIFLIINDEPSFIGPRRTVLIYLISINKKIDYAEWMTEKELQSYLQ